MEFKELLNHLILDYQEDFPLMSQPFHQIAQDLGVTPKEVQDGYRYLQEKKILSRLGPVINTHSVGYSFLAAVECPECRIPEVAEAITRLKEVNHNYLRENKLNLWFVCTGKSAEKLEVVIEDLEKEIGLKVHKFPMKRSFKIDLRARDLIDWSGL